jgi:energy-coupling factor transporter ATP-binding protein EcfA2
MLRAIAREAAFVQDESSHLASRVGVRRVDSLEISPNRATAFVGPSGSGKSELAVTLALLSAGSRRVALADLDVLKPYFRSREAGGELERAGVELIAPQGALSQSDLPIVPPSLRGILARGDTQVFLDVGGDPTGARALGSVSDLVARAPYDVLLVLNRHRPFTDDAPSALAVARQIEGAAQLRITGVVSNTNLGDETTESDVLWGLELAREVAASLGVPLRLLGLTEPLQERLSGHSDLPQRVVLRRRMVPNFMGGSALAPSLRQRRP